MDGKFHFIVFLLFIRYAISQNCDCKLVDILRNIVQREMMEREMLVSRVEMLESKQGSGTSNGAGSSGYSSEANILKRLSVIETMIENINTKLKETTTERQNGGRLYSALTDAWRIHKHALWITNENIENKINDNNNRFNQLTREAEKSIEVVELKVDSLINQTNEKASKQLKEVEDRVEVIHIGLNKTFKDYTTQMNTDLTRFVNKTDRMLNEISSDECASDPCKNGATCVDGIQRYTCICMTGYGGSQCQIDQSNQKVDGGWNVWGPWSGCSASCNTGMESRNRACSNPKPSNGGDHCIGESAEYRLCNKFECPDQKVDGGWREWESWSECSASCGTGMKSRKRVRSWPKPSIGGDYCSGGPVEYQLCNRRSCPSTGIGFSVYAPVKGTGGGSSILKFSHVVENSGGAFNMTTGEFVCRQSGLYYFSNTVIRFSSTTQAAYCSFYKNRISHSYVAGYADDTDTVYTSGTNAILYHLLPGETVSLRSCENSNYIASASSFTGFLVHADN